MDTREAKNRILEKHCHSSNNKTYRCIRSNDIVNACTDNCIYGFEHCEYMVAIEALEKQENYCWHDLRKNSEDLPDGNWDKKLLCVVITHGKKYYSVMSYRRAEFLHEISNDKIKRLGFLERVIAWRYIEPFDGGGWRNESTGSK